MELKTKECFQLLNIINKMDIKKELIDSIMEISILQKSLQKVQQQLLNKAESEGVEIRVAVENNIGLAEKYDTISSDIQSKGMGLIFLLMEKLPKAEKEVYSFFSKTHKCTVKEVEEWDAEKFISAIKEVATNKAFISFFTLMNK